VLAVLALQITLVLTEVIRYLTQLLLLVAVLVLEMRLLQRLLLVVLVDHRVAQ